MKQILVYGDSLSWGIIPGTRERLEFEERWPGVLETGLKKTNTKVRVIENCLNGRCTAWEDPFKPGRNGLSGVQQVLEIHAPLDLIIILLGTNDFQSVHTNAAAQSAQGMAALIQTIRTAPIEPGMPVAPILLVAPPRIVKAMGAMTEKFHEAERKSLGLEKRYEALSRDLDCSFFDAGSVVQASQVDGVHLDKAEHLILGEALIKPVGKIIGG